jgi:BCCT family betaine/carnitine transporter
MASVAAIGFLAWLAASRYGRTKLGEADESPEFGTFSWVAMLFCAGVGAGLMFWCVTEWSYYYVSPPFGAEPRTPDAAEWASTYGLFHWGFTAWAFYCLPAVCNWFLAGREHGTAARVIDFLFMIALIGGAASSLGFSTPMIAACVAWILGVEPTFALEAGVIVLCVLMFAGSVWLGLRRGIKRLSDVNLALAFGLLLFVLVVGPTTFLLKTSLNGVGVMAQNFLRMNFWTDPFTESNFVEDWTVFYWAWWIAYAPYVGLFVTRISRGRTIRQVITGMLILGSLGSWVFYMVLGNFAMFQELSGNVDFTGIVAAIDGNAAIVATLETLPLAPLVIGTFAVVALIFSATTYDSASYTLASSATLHLRAGDDPARWHRVFWALALGLMPVTLMFIGGLKVLQVTLLIVSLPILVVCTIAAVSLVRSLRADTAD